MCSYESQLLKLLGLWIVISGCNADIKVQLYEKLGNSRSVTAPASEPLQSVTSPDAIEDWAVQGSVVALAANVTSFSDISLSWDPTAHATGYTIAYASGAIAPADCSNMSNTLVQTAGNTTSIVLSGLMNNTQYSFRVCAKSGTSLSSGSVVTVSTDNGTLALSGLSASPAGKALVVLGGHCRGGGLSTFEIKVDSENW